MNPLIGIFAIIWVVRALTGGGKAQAGTARAANGTEVSPAAVVFVVKFFLFAFALSTANDFNGPILASLLNLAALPIFLPTLFLRWVLVPLGMFRLAYWWFRCTWPFGFGKEFRVGAVYYGTLALASKGATPERIEWLKKRLPQISASSAPHETVTALLAALAGEREVAQLMLHSIDVTRGPRNMRSIARDWLVMDATRRGDWQEAIWRGRRGRDSFRWSYAVARIAERVDRPAMAAPDWQLIGLWLLAPRRRNLFPFLKKALETPRAKKKRPTVPPAPKDFPAALADLAGMLTQMSKSGQVPDREYFLATVRWANLRAESPAVHLLIQERLKALDPLRSDSKESADAIVRSFQEQLIELVVPIIERSPHLVRGEGERPVIREAIDRIRQSTLQEIEVRCGDYDHRTKNQSNLERHAEWGAWATLRNRAEQVLKMDGGAEDALFQVMYAPLCNFAVYQHNTIANHRLAHDMFCWLREHAKSNREASELLARNMAAYSWRWVA
ncbi:MAG TPA: hypothetical protein VIF60_22670 [Burkholderiaceae bacterium]